MSSGIKSLELSADDGRKMLAAKVHLGFTNCNYQMAQYVFKRATGGAHVFDIQKCWEKIALTARIIAAVENPQDVCIISAKDLGQRAIIKCAKFCGATTVNGRFSPGTFTNHSQAGFREPRLIIVTDPSVDHQAIREASYVNIPVVALCDSDSDLKYVDVAIPCNNRAPHSIGLIYWFLAREVQRLKGKLARGEDWSVMPDLFFYRNQEEIKKQEEDERKAADDAVVEAVEQGQDDYAAGEYDYAAGEAGPGVADAAGAAGVNENWAADSASAAQQNQDWTAEANAGGDWANAEASQWS